MDPRAVALHPSRPRHDPWIVVVMVAVVVVPATLTLLRIEEARDAVDPRTDPTPLGYTWSLLLFVLPVAVLALWFLRHPRLSFQKKAFWITVAILVPLGFVLDLLFGTMFFEFPNHGAVLGIDVPAVGGIIPLEELVFYTSGFLFVLLLYAWADEYWMEAYNVPDYSAESGKVDRLLHFDLRSLIVGVVLLSATVAYKKTLAEDPEGFPLYFAYLVAAAVIPSIGFYRAVARFINWRAFSLTFFFVLLVSLMWEATLGVPYGWWTYNERMMIGVFIGGWTSLPLEAVVVWLAVTYTSVIVYETVKVYRASGKSLRDALIGHRSSVGRSGRGLVIRRRQLDLDAIGVREVDLP